MPKDTIELHFPVGGLHEQHAYQSQPPYTTADANNVRSRDTIQQRIRGGSRPGLVKAFAQELGGGSPVRLLNSVREITTSQGTTFSDTFSVGDYVTDSDAWSAASWVADGAPPIAHGWAHGYFSTPPGAREVGAVLAARSPTINVTTASYSIRLEFRGELGQLTTESFLDVFCRMSDSTPGVTTGGVWVSCGMQAQINGTQTVTLRIHVYSGGSLVESYQTSLGDLVSGTGQGLNTLYVTVNPTGSAANRIVVDWASTTYGTSLQLDQTLTTAAAGQRLGFGLRALGGDIRANYFTLNYTQSGTSGADWNRTRVVAASGTDLYEENNSGEMIDVGTIAAQVRPLSSVEYLGYLYVADRGSGTIKIYDPSDGSYEDLSDFGTPVGTIPTACELITTFQDCLVVARQATTGQPASPAGAPSPHMWYMSRLANPLDWDYGDTDVAAATAGVNTDLAGKLPAPITAMFSFTDDYLIFGSNRKVFVMRGHPRRGGFIDTISHTAGIVDAHAWCRGPSNQVWFLSHDGIYQIVSGEEGYAGGLGVTRISARLPERLQRIDVVNSFVLMAYDPNERGMYVCVTPNVGNAAGSYDNWFYDLEANAFWPMSFADGHAPTHMHYYDSDDPQAAAVLFGCRDGYVRKFSASASTDDGEEIASYVQYGPIMLGAGPNGYGRVKELIGTTDPESDSVTWEVMTGESAQGALAAASRSDLSGTWEGGRNYCVRPRSGGKSAYVMLSSTGRWAVETLALTREAKGGPIRHTA